MLSPLCPVPHAAPASHRPVVSVAAPLEPAAVVLPPLSLHSSSASGPRCCEQHSLSLGGWTGGCRDLELLFHFPPYSWAYGRGHRGI